MTRSDRGSATVELVIAAPVFALLFALVVAAGRTQASRADVEAAAHGAARTITLARDPEAGVAQAEADAREALPTGSPTCRSMGWNAELTETRATVTITCTVDLSDAAMLPVPGALTVSASADEVFDVYREKGDGFGIADETDGAGPSLGVSQ